MDISQEKLAELLDVSVQAIKSIEGRRTWVSDVMLEKLAKALGVSAFQLLEPQTADTTLGESALVTALLDSLKLNIQSDIDDRFSRLQEKR